MLFLANIRRPYYLILYVTSRCNATCAYCLNASRWKNASKDTELTIGELKRLAAKSPFLRVLSLTGGEPLLRHDIGEIVDVFVRASGVRYITLHTNGTQPARLEAVLKHIKGLRRIKYFNVCLSLDDIGERHDSVRGIKGLFEKNLECIRLVRDCMQTDRRIDLLTGTVLHAGNADRIGEIHAYITRELKVPNDIDISRTATAAERDTLIKAFKRLHSRAPAGAARSDGFLGVKSAIDALVPSVISEQLSTGARCMPCIAGRNLLVLYEDGSVAPCEVRSEILGNVRDSDYDLRVICRGPVCRAARASIRKRECACGWPNPIPFNIVCTPRLYWRVLKARCDGRRTARSGIRHREVQPPSPSWIGDQM